ncbi:MAG: dTMP kinase [Gemmatimonadota bacterium]|nr:dTMP kinase [Gemmatimonadota bacterium]
MRSPAVVSRGHFIVFEGVDGSGTTTQSRLLASHLREAGLPVILTREPGGTPIGERIRRLVLDKKQEAISHVAELLLYGADRAQHVEEVIQPSLDQGKVVICDRYTASSLAYQGYGRGLNLKMVEQVNSLAVGECLPELTVYLDLPVEVTWARIDRQGDLFRQGDSFSPRAEDRLEEAGGEQLQRKVAEGYKKIAKKYHQTSLVFDAQLGIDQLAKEIRNALRERLQWFPEEKK